MRSNLIYKSLIQRLISLLIESLSFTFILKLLLIDVTKLPSFVALTPHPQYPYIHNSPIESFYCFYYEKKKIENKKKDKCIGRGMSEI